MYIVVDTQRSIQIWLEPLLKPIYVLCFIARNGGDQETDTETEEGEEEPTEEGSRHKEGEGWNGWQEGKHWS